MDFGTIDWVDIGYISAILITNIVDQVIKGQDLIESSLYTLPFILAVFFIHFLPLKKYWKSLIFVVFGILIHKDQPDPDGFQSLLFFIFAFSEVQSVRMAILICISTLAVFLYKGTSSGQSIPQAVNMIILAAFVYNRSFIKFFKTQVLEFHDTTETLSPEQEKILTMIGIRGLSQKEIAYELGVSQDVVYNKILELRKMYSIGEETITLNQLIFTIASSEKPLRKKE